MLTELYVENVAILQRARLCFGPGLNVLTGETGAGKSLLIDAVSVLLGGRASEDLIGAAGDRATITAVFDLSNAEAARQAASELGYDIDEDMQLVVTRELSRTGRNSGRINSRPATVAAIRAIAGNLVALHGQHDQQVLMEPAHHRNLVDVYGSSEISPLLSAVRRLYDRVCNLQSELDSLAGDERQRARTVDLFRFQLQEIDQAQLRTDEEEQLAAARHRLANFERLQSALSHAYTVLVDGLGQAPAVQEQIGSAISSLQRAVEIDPGAAEALSLLQSAAVHLEETTFELRRRLDELDLDPVNAEALEQRWTLLSDLKRKYGASVSEILAYRQQLAADLERLLGAEERAAAIESELAAVNAELTSAAAELTARRRAAAHDLKSELERELTQLAMTATIDVLIMPVNGPIGEHGADHVEILMAANPGEHPRPLQRVASGGELSRLMLAFKTLFGRLDATPTLIFDEVDAGIGGRTANVVAEKLAQLSGFHQVLCVTHLPQIAALADHHFAVEKTVTSAGQTEVSVIELSSSDRERELARMMAGEMQDVDLQHARVLLRRAREQRANL